MGSNPQRLFCFPCLITMVIDPGPFWSLCCFVGSSHLWVLKCGAPALDEPTLYSNCPVVLLLSVRCAVTLGCHLDRRTVIWIDALSAWVSHVSLLAHKWLEHEKCAAMVVVKWGARNFVASYLLETGSSIGHLSSFVIRSSP
jgi:hypothetical protein